MSDFVFERPALLEALLARVRSGAPLLLEGPPGAGKTTLLGLLATALKREGFAVVSLDLMGAASSPERFVAAALGALPAEHFASRMGDALEIRRLAGAGRAHAAEAVHALFSLFASLDEAGGRPVALLLDEATEIRSLAYFKGLREVARPFTAALRARRRGTLLATSFPTLARTLLGIDGREVPPLVAAELQPWAGSATDEILRLSFGWARHARILLDALPSHAGLAAAWVAEMSPGGRLETACRATYESLLLRSRGYGVSKALLAMIAHQEGQNLTALYRQLGRSPGATRDYLGWLLGVDAVRMLGKRYHFVDGLVACWLRLYGRGRQPLPREIEAAAAELGALRRDEADEPEKRKESLIEID